jgi:hypothetical protein
MGEREMSERENELLEAIQWAWKHRREHGFTYWYADPEAMRCKNLEEYCLSIGNTLSGEHNVDSHFLTVWTATVGGKPVVIGYCDQTLPDGMREAVRKQVWKYYVAANRPTGR